MSFGWDEDVIQDEEDLAYFTGYEDAAHMNRVGDERWSVPPTVRKGPRVLLRTRVHTAKINIMSIGVLTGQTYKTSYWSRTDQDGTVVKWNTIKILKGDS